MVLAPIDPVAPSSVTVRSRSRAIARCGTQRVRTSSTHHTNRPRPGASKPPRANPISAASNAGGDETVEAVHQPAMSGNEVARILRAEPALERRTRTDLRPARRPTTTIASMAIATSPASAAALATATATRTAATVPPSAPDQVFFGLTRGTSLGPPSRAPDEIGDDVGRPHDREQKHHGQESVLARRSAARSAPARAHRHTGCRRQPISAARPAPAPPRRACPWRAR